MARPTPTIDLDRLRRLLDGVNAFGFNALTGGYNRIGYSAEDMAVRDWFAREMGDSSEPVSRHTILGDIWSNEVTTRTVDTHIWNLREKLEEDPGNPKHIITVHRIGYKFVE